MEGFEVNTLEAVLDTADIFITSTGNKGIITAEHMAKMKHNAIVGNIGHFDNEIDMAGLARQSDVRKVEIKPQVHEFVFPDGHSIIVLSEGRLLNLGNATGHPSFVMSMSFTNQVLAQIELYTQTEQYPLGVYVLPEAPRRAGRPAPPRRPRREAHAARPGPGRLPRHPRRRPLQARQLPVLRLRSRQRRVEPPVRPRPADAAAQGTAEPTFAAGAPAEPLPTPQPDALRHVAPMACVAARAGRQGVATEPPAQWRGAADSSGLARAPRGAPEGSCERRWSSGSGIACGPGTSGRWGRRSGRRRRCRCPPGRRGAHRRRAPRARCRCGPRARSGRGGRCRSSGRRGARGRGRRRCTSRCPGRTT